METDANNLVDRDPKTNAIIPVMQQYSTELEKTEVNGNYLFVRGEKNALIPVVKVLDSSDNQNGITLTDAVNAVRLDTVKLWYNTIQSLELFLNASYNRMGSNSSYVPENDRSLLKQYATPLFGALNSTKYYLKTALDSEKIDDKLYTSIKNEYDSVIKHMAIYIQKESYCERLAANGQAWQPLSYSGTLAAGAKKDIYPSFFTFRLKKNTNDKYMTLSMTSRAGQRTCFFEIIRNGVFETREFKVEGGSYFNLFENLGSVGAGETLRIVGIDKEYKTRFHLDVLVTYSSDMSNPDIYHISCQTLTITPYT